MLTFYQRQDPFRYVRTSTNQANSRVAPDHAGLIRQSLLKSNTPRHRIQSTKLWLDSQQHMRTSRPKTCASARGRPSVKHTPTFVSFKCQKLRPRPRALSLESRANISKFQVSRVAPTYASLKSTGRTKSTYIPAPIRACFKSQESRLLPRTSSQWPVPSQIPHLRLLKSDLCKLQNALLRISPRHVYVMIWVACASG